MKVATSRTHNQNIFAGHKESPSVFLVGLNSIKSYVKLRLFDEKIEFIWCNRGLKSG
jgi:hypothetical protein